MANGNKAVQPHWYTEDPDVVEGELIESAPAEPFPPAWQHPEMQASDNTPDPNKFILTLIGVVGCISLLITLVLYWNDWVLLLYHP